ncbi:hypothetical protein [Glutamicibacter sp. TV12E]|uniref:hypothetical protein n=1 Tax=Glutamicibacter sp. TV12E TaxID=3446362 RepID=UPI004033410F
MHTTPRTNPELIRDLELLGTELEAMLNIYDNAATETPEILEFVTKSTATRFREIQQAMAQIQAERMENVIRRTEIPDDISSLVAGE